jgi:hypothetical protein
MTGPRPDYKDLLRRVSLASGKGASIADLDAYVRRESNGALQNVHDLAGASTQPQGNQKKPDMMDAFRQAMYGLTLHNSPRIRGAIQGAIPGGMGYEEAKNAEQANIDATRQALPGGSMFAEAVGSLPLMLAPTGAAIRAGAGPAAIAEAGGLGAGIGGAAGAITNPGDRIGGAIRGTIGGGLIGAGLPGTGLPAALKAMGIGAGFGGAIGLGNTQSDNPGDIAKGIGTGAAGGAVVGLATPLLLRGIVKSVGGVSNLVQHLNNPDAAAQRAYSSQLIRELQNIGATPKEAYAQLQKMKNMGADEAVMADQHPDLAASLRKALNNSPGTKTELLTGMKERGAGRGGRMMAAAEDAMGVTRGEAQAQREGSIGWLRRLGNKLYKRFDSAEITPEMDQRIQAFLYNPETDALDPNIAKAMRGMYKVGEEVTLPDPRALGRLTPEQVTERMNANGGTLGLTAGRRVPVSGFGQLRDIRDGLLEVVHDPKTPNWSREAWQKKLSELTDIMEDVAPGYHGAPGYRQTNALWRRGAIRAASPENRLARTYETSNGMVMQDAWLTGASWFAKGANMADVSQDAAGLLEIGGPKALQAAKSAYLEQMASRFNRAGEKGEIADALLETGQEQKDVMKFLFQGKGKGFGRLADQAKIESGMLDTENAVRGARPKIQTAGEELQNETRLGTEAGAFGVTRSLWSLIRSARQVGRQMTGDVAGKANQRLIQALTSQPNPTTQAEFERLQEMLRRMQFQNPTTRALQNYGAPVVTGSQAGNFLTQPPGQQTTPY